MPPFKAVKEQVPYLQGEKLGLPKPRVIIKIIEVPKIIYRDSPNYSNLGGH